MAHDLTDQAEPALRSALELGARLGSTIHVLHVVTPPLSVPPGGWFRVPESEVAAWGQRVRQAATQELERVVGKALREGGPEVQLHVTLGEPGEAILAEARRLGAGLIVMGTRGRKGWQHMMLGSVAERIVRTAPVPVLTLSPTA
jgi:nucleotide-binding universal stress UspA family protein